MPLIQVTLMEGRPDEKKEELIHALTQTTHQVIDAPLENIRVLINEVPPNHWGISGVSVKKLRDKGKR